MLRSFDYAARYVLPERRRTELAEPRAAGRGRGRPTTGRPSSRATCDVPGIDALLPEARVVAGACSLAYELDKALYELDYEQAHRPDWVAIPARRIRRLMQGRRRPEWVGRQTWQTSPAS